MSEHPEGKRVVPKRYRVRRKKSSARVTRYLVILFGAAFLLLFMAMLMQNRANKETIDDLTESMTSIHSLQNMVEVNTALTTENEALKEQVAALENRVAELEEDFLSAATRANTLDQQMAKNLHAMDWFWQLNEAFVRGRYTLCREIIATMEDTSNGPPLTDYLSMESCTDNGRFSPYDRYQEIRAAFY